jgi:hypothetical protein
MEPATFSRLWNGIVALPLFQRSVATDMGAYLDPDAQHIIGINYTQGGQFDRCVVLIPRDDPDPALAGWLELLNVPVGSRTPPTCRWSRSF